MKKICVLVCIMGLLCMGAAPLYAGGIINKQNLSTEYIRTLNRNAATDSADIAVYNPAGVMKLENGLYTKLDMLYVHKDYSNTVPGFGKFESDEPSFIPGFFSVYKQDKWSAFFAVSIPAGGGKVDYPDGDASTVALSSQIINQANAMGMGVVYTGINDMSLEADSLMIGFSLGAAYKFNEMLSMSGGLRLIDAKQNFKGQTVLNRNPLNPASDFFPTTYEVDLERTATGLGYFLGFNVTPTERLNIGLTFFSNTKLDFESDVKSGDDIAAGLGWADGTKQREDLPGVLGLGVSYWLTPKLRTEANYTLYLENSATLESDRFRKTGNSWDLGIAFEYTINPQWKTSIGYMKTEIGVLPTENKLPQAAELDANSVAAGVVFGATERLQLSLGVLKVWYDSEEMESGVKLEKDVWAAALGIQYRFF
jgi:long-chain fatty acid transport protein